jgi:hypothetical protein
MYELDELNYTCGPIMADKIAKLIKDMKYNYAQNYDKSDSVNLKRMDACLNLLLTADYDTFYFMYVGMPADYKDYFNNGINVKLMDVGIKYNYFEYTQTILSNTVLIKRCLEISREPLNKALNVMSEYNNLYVAELNTNFGIESCELLYHNKFNIVNLLHIMRYKQDYTAIKFLISVMTEQDMKYTLHNKHYRCGITDILLIDKCKQLGNKYIISLLYNTIIYSAINLSIAYYIINIMSYENGLKYIKELKRSASQLSDLNTLLAYHFRPRGTHTKGAIAAF